VFQLIILKCILTIVLNKKTFEVLGISRYYYIDQQNAHCFPYWCHLLVIKTQGNQNMNEVGFKHNI
jgi:hypothetical protein